MTELQNRESNQFNIRNNQLKNV